jgi:hypothetical protein
VERDSVVSRVLDRPRHQHLRARRRELEHLLVRHRIELACSRRDPRVGREDAVDVGVDLADVGAERRRERNRRRVGAAAAEGRRIGVGRDALEAGDDHDLAVRERGAHALRPDLDDSRLPVRGVGEDPGLGSRQRDGVAAEVEDRHREQRDRDLLSRRQEHVALARMRQRRDLVREVEQLVGRVTHR